MRSRAAATAFALSAALLAACGAEPKLDVQPQSSAPAPAAAQAPAEPAAAPAAAPVETLPAHAAETPAGELPAGHPPIADLPPGHPPMDAAAAAQMPVMVPEVTPGAGQGDQAIAWTAPAGWVAEPPANAMRHARASATSSTSGRARAARRWPTPSAGRASSQTRRASPRWPR